MKVLLLNGSPRKEGCTYTALTEIAETLKKNGVEAEIFQAGDPSQENVADAAAIMKEADALIVGSPVYWASPSGQIIEFMDKFASKAGKDMIHKPAAAVASARRAGTTATLDVLIKYFTYHQMPVVSGNYWTMVHGNTPDDVRKDAEGLQIMRTLGNNMAWLLKCIEAGKKYFSVASGGGTGRTLHPDNMAAGPASYGMTDTLGRMHSDAQFAGSSSVPAHVEMMGLIGAGNNPMVGMTVAVAVSIEEAAKAGKF